jgi:hypothetical protein
MMAWTLVHGGRSEATWCPPSGCQRGRFFGDPGVSSGPARIDQAISPDGRGAVVIAYGGRPPFVLRNAMGCAARVRILHPRPDETLGRTEAAVPAGGTLELPAYRVGRLLLARCE